jgi:subtilisin family serine protease
MKIAVVILAVVVASALSAPSTKIEARLSSTLKTKGTANVLVSFREKPSSVLGGFRTAKWESREVRLNTVANTLRALSARTQASALEVISAQETAVDHQIFWITNQIYIRNADASLIDQLAALEGVTDISEEFEVRLEEPIAAPKRARNSSTLAAEWGIVNVEAEAVWATGNTGEGIVVANIDSGVLSTHPDLAGNFRSDYGWRDATIFHTEDPRDNNGHGTHCMGSIAGANGIGVAPGAKWIACKALTGEGAGTNAGLIDCGQWVACPTLPNGQSPDCTKAPNVVSNSWGGGQANPFYNEVINAWHAAGIVPVFANGNSGPDCTTANSPADSLADVIAVGATDVTNALAYFSSRGPTVGGRTKPDISGPGFEITSAWNDGDYNTISGTSMACPHVTGVTALVLAANPNQTFEQVKTALYNNANRDNIVANGQNCGGILETTYPNNAFGNGIVNARKAVESVKNL